MKNIFRNEVAKRRAAIRIANRNFPADKFIQVDQEKINSDGVKNRIAAFRSRDVFVQVFAEAEGFLRLAINRTDIDKSGNWIDGLTWDSIQFIKDSLGFSECDAFEAYPRKDDIVNVSNMRHLFVCPPGTIMTQFWRNKVKEDDNGTTSESAAAADGGAAGAQQPEAAQAQPDAGADAGGEAQHASRVIVPLREAHDTP